MSGRRTSDRLLAQRNGLVLDYPALPNKRGRHRSSSAASVSSNASMASSSDSALARSKWHQLERANFYGTGSVPLSRPSDKVTALDGALRGGGRVRTMRAVVKGSMEAETLTKYETVLDLRHVMTVVERNGWKVTRVVFASEKVARKRAKGGQEVIELGDS